MWQPRRLTTLWASTDYNRDRFTLTLELLTISLISRHCNYMYILTGLWLYLPINFMGDLQVLAYTFQDNSMNVGFEVLTAVVMKTVIFLDIAPCSPYINRSFGGTYHLHLQGRKSAERECSAERSKSLIPWLCAGRTPSGKSVCGIPTTLLLPLPSPLLR
jgi:hypothetical protein